MQKSEVRSRNAKQAKEIRKPGKLLTTEFAEAAAEFAEKIRWVPNCYP